MADSAVKERIDVTLADVFLGPIRLITQRIAVRIELIRIPFSVELGDTVHWP